MSITLTQSRSAVSAGITSSIAVSGGTAPYTYSVRAGGAGGTVSTSGLYQAPSVNPTTPQTVFDVIQVRDSSGLSSTTQILVGDALILFCDIIQSELGLANGRVYLWDQKIPQNYDGGIYVVVQVLSCKPFANTISHDSSGPGLNSVQSINMQATLQIDIQSRDSSARLRKEEVLMALTSDYAQSQQEANSFSIGRLPPGSQFVNLSSQDGAAIPYRFVISASIQYFVTKSKPVSYINQFQPASVNYIQK